MNSVQKTVLQRYHQQLADDIMMTEDLFGALYQKKVFELKMIDTIKVSVDFLTNSSAPGKKGYWYNLIIHISP